MKSASFGSARGAFQVPVSTRGTSGTSGDSRYVVEVDEGSEHERDHERSVASSRQTQSSFQSGVRFTDNGLRMKSRNGASGPTSLADVARARRTPDALAKAVRFTPPSKAVTRSGAVVEVDEGSSNDEHSEAPSVKSGYGQRRTERSPLRASAGTSPLHDRPSARARSVSPGANSAASRQGIAGSSRPRQFGGASATAVAVNGNGAGMYVNRSGRQAPASQTQPPRLMTDPPVFGGNASAGPAPSSARVADDQSQKSVRFDPYLQVKLTDSYRHDRHDENTTEDDLATSEDDDSEFSGSRRGVSPELPQLEELTPQRGGSARQFSGKNVAAGKRADAKSQARRGQSEDEDDVASADAVQEISLLQSDIEDTPRSSVGSTRLLSTSAASVAIAPPPVKYAQAGKAPPASRSKPLWDSVDAEDEATNGTDEKDLTQEDDEEDDGEESEDINGRGGSRSMDPRKPGMDSRSIRRADPGDVKLTVQDFEPPKVAGASKPGIRTVASGAFMGASLAAHRFFSRYIPGVAPPQPTPAELASISTVDPAMEKRLVRDGHTHKDVYMSFAKGDRDICVRLIKDLEKEGVKVHWVDWQKYENTQRRNEVYTKMKAASTVLCLITPEWSDSSDCLKELAQAVSQEKELLPILCEATDDVPDELAAKKWIYLRDGQDDYAKSLQTLVYSLGIDPQLLRLYNMLMKQAVEWENTEKSRLKRALLLRGRGLRKAEEWLVEAPIVPGPQPTTKIIVFVRASQLYEQELLKIKKHVSIGVLAALALAFIISMIVAIVSSAQLKNTRSERDQLQINYNAMTARATQAEAEAGTMSSKLLTTRALTTADTDPQLALLQSVAVAKYAISNKLPVVGLAVNAIRQILGKVGGVYLAPNYASLIAALPTPKPTTAPLPDDGTVLSARMRTLLSTSDVSSSTMAFLVTGAHFSQNSRWLVTWDVTNALLVWDLSSTSMLATKLSYWLIKQPSVSDSILSATITRDNTYIVVAVNKSGTPQLVSWDLTSTAASGATPTSSEPKAGSWRKSVALVAGNHPTDLGSSNFLASISMDCSAMDFGGNCNHTLDVWYPVQKAPASPPTRRFGVSTVRKGLGLYTCNDGKTVVAAFHVPSAEAIDFLIVSPYAWYDPTLGGPFWARIWYRPCQVSTDKLCPDVSTLEIRNDCQQAVMSAVVRDPVYGNMQTIMSFSLSQNPIQGGDFTDRGLQWVDVACGRGPGLPSAQGTRWSSLIGFSDGNSRLVYSCAPGANVYSQNASTFDGRQLLGVLGDALVTAYTQTTGKDVATGESYTGILFVGDSDGIVSTNYKTTQELLRPKSRMPLLHDAVTLLTASPDARLVLASDESGHTGLFDLSQVTTSREPMRYVLFDDSAPVGTAQFSVPSGSPCWLFVTNHGNALGYPLPTVADQFSGTSSSQDAWSRTAAQVVVAKTGLQVAVYPIDQNGYSSQFLLYSNVFNCGSQVSNVNPSATILLGGGPVRLRSAVAFSPDGKQLAVGGALYLTDASAIASNVAPSVFVPTNGTNQNQVYQTQFCSAGTYFAVRIQYSTGGFYAAVWATPSAGRAVGDRLVNQPMDSNRKLQFGDDCGYVYFWKAGSFVRSAVPSTGLVPQTVYSPSTSSPVLTVVVAPNGQSAVVLFVNGTAQMWTIAALLSGNGTYQYSFSYDYHPRMADDVTPVVSSSSDPDFVPVVFSPDSTYLAYSNAISSASQLTVLDLTTSNPLLDPYLLYNLNGRYMTAAISPDNKLVAVTLYKSGVETRYLDVQSLMTRACRTAGRDMTDAEWSDMFPSATKQCVCC